MPWTYVLTDRAGTALGELRQATGRKWSRGMKSGRSAAFTIQTKNHLAGAVADLDKVLLKVYDDRDGTK